MGAPPVWAGAVRPENRLVAGSRPPQKVDGAALAHEAAAELMEHPIYMHQPEPEPLCLT